MKHAKVQNNKQDIEEKRSKQEQIIDVLGTGISNRLLK